MKASTRIESLVGMAAAARSCDDAASRPVCARGIAEPDKAAVDRFGRIVAAEWRRRGAQGQRSCGSGNGAITFVQSGIRQGVRAKGQILVLGHLDTVYGLGTLARMPFRLSRGRAYGPGTFDMKGGLVIALFAVDALAAAGFQPEKRIVFLWTSDEEIGSGTSRALIEREARRSDAVLVLEPASGLEGSRENGPQRAWAKSKSSPTAARHTPA